MKRRHPKQGTSPRTPQPLTDDEAPPPSRMPVTIGLLLLVAGFVMGFERLLHWLFNR